MYEYKKSKWETNTESVFQSQRIRSEFESYLIA